MHSQFGYEDTVHYNHIHQIHLPTPLHTSRRRISQLIVYNLS